MRLGPLRARRTRMFAAIFAGFVGALGIACGIDSVATKEFPSTASDASVPEVSLPPTGDADVPETAPVDASTDASPTCPTGHGPMVVVDAGGLTFCIDATEVRNDAYAAFVAATDGGDVDSGVFDAGKPTGCSGNDTYAPSIDAGGPDFPVTYVDWCDARAYCLWAGKRLCGKTVAGDASTGEWFAACSNGGRQPYPYGSTYTAGACNDKNVGVAATGSFAGCQGSVPGLYDMNSNVAELIDNCNAATCSLMGGSYSGPGACAAESAVGKTLATDFIGFRCCSEAP